MLVSVLAPSGRLAQLGKLIPYKDGLTGLNPVPATTVSLMMRVVIQLVRRSPITLEVTVSNPVSPATASPAMSLQKEYVHSLFRRVVDGLIQREMIEISRSGVAQRNNFRE